MLSYFPRYLTNRSIYLYLVVLVVCNLVFLSSSLPIIFLGFGLVEVLGFFYYVNILTRRWEKTAENRFVKSIFWNAFFIRLAWVLFSFVFYNYMTGQPFEFSAADAVGYHGEAEWLSRLIENNKMSVYFDYIKGRYSDMGYTLYLGSQYWITGGSILIARILKSVYGAITCVLIYRLARRNFGENVARISAVLCLLMPNLIYYAGIHTKEVEMLLLTTLFVERADFVLRENSINVISSIFLILLGGSLFFFRTVLGITALFAIFSAILMSKQRVSKMANRIILSVWIGLAVLFFAGGSISSEVEKVWVSRTTNQELSLKFRTERTNGNRLAKYASGAIFVPFIIVIPFPTVVGTPYQENQQLLNGGNYVKNILSFFVVLGFYWIIRMKQWRNHVMLGAFTIGYLLIIALSAFAQSERFHQPALPFMMIFAAVGLSRISNSQKKYFGWYMLFIFIAIVGWSWYKLAGRGLA
jgi:4-amino-4-deoxy-L-arabinose transferase-like glycosyltransferase